MARKSADSELARAGRVGCEGAGWSSETRRNQGGERGNRMIFIADPQPIAQIVPERQAKLLAGLRKAQHAVARLAAVATDRASGNLPLDDKATQISLRRIGVERDLRPLKIGRAHV